MPACWPALLHGAAEGDVAAACKAYQRKRQPQLRFYQRAGWIVSLLSDSDTVLRKATQQLGVNLLRNSGFVRRQLLTAVCGYARRAAAIAHS